MNLNSVAVAVVGAALLAATVGPARAAIWHVNPSGTGDAPTIQAAFDAASPGDVIELAPGVYTDINTRPTAYGTASAVAHMSPGVSIVGAAGAAATIIDGQGFWRGLFGISVGSAEIQGITFRDCYTSGSSGGPTKWGGGLLLFDSAATLEQCVFVGCWTDAGGGGGGALFFNGPTASVRDNLFVRCFADDIGGGLEIYNIDSATIEGNTFVANSATRGGGALLLNQSGAQVDRNIFYGNSVLETVGAIWCLNGGAYTASCNLFWGNAGPIDDNVDECGFTIGVDGNGIADPMFCDPVTDDYHVSSMSPAAPQHSAGCGLIGAFPVACGPVSVAPSTWGKIKATYR